MAIKNRFFKTTQGVPYEFAACKVANPTTIHNSGSATAADVDATYKWNEILAGTSAKAGSTGASAHAAGDLYLLRQNPTTGITYVARNDGTAAAVFRTGAYKTWPHQLAWCVNGTTKQYYTTSQFIPEKCDPIERYAYTGTTMQSVVLTSSGIPVGCTQELYFKIIETTPGNLPLPVWDYTIQLNSTMTEANAWSCIAQKITYGSYNAVTPVTSGTPKEGEFFTATAGGNGITIAASSSATGVGTTENNLAASRTFKLVAALLPTKSDPTDYGVVFTSTTTAHVPGVGIQQQVEDLFAEANVRSGVEYYMNGGVLPSEMGIPSTLNGILGADYAWTIYKISGVKAETSKTPATIGNKFYIFVAVKNTATAQDTDATFHSMFGGSSYNA